MSLLDAVQLATGSTPTSSGFDTVDQQKKKKNSLLEAVQVARGDISPDSLNQSTQQTQNNPLQSLVSSITSFVKDKVSEIFHPNSFLDTNKLPSNLSLDNNNNTQNPSANLNLSGKPQNNQLPILGNKINIPAPPKIDNGNSSNLISPFNTGVPFVDLAPSTMDLLANLQVDPFSLKNAPKVTLQSLFNPLGRGPIADNITNNYLKGIKDAVSADAEAIKGVFNAQSTSERVGAGAQVAARSVGAAISPLTSLFNAANDIPVLGTVSKLISLPFAVIGDTGKDLAYPVVNMLPISRQAKLNLVDGIGEITSLALMLGVGGKVADIPGKMREELATKYGPDGAATIEEQAKVLAQQKIDTQQKSFTPEEIRSQTKNFGMEGTPTGQILNQAATVAENQGKNIKILPAPEDQKLLPATSSIPVTTGEGLQVSDTVNKQKLEVAKAINEYNDVYRKYNTSPTSAKLKKLIELKTKKDQLVQQYNQTEGITGNYMAEMPGGHAVSVELTDKNQSQSEQQPAGGGIGKRFQTLNEGGVIKTVEGKPVKLVDGVDTFIHKGDNPQRYNKGFIVSEKSTGKYIATGDTEREAIANAKQVINTIGEDKFRQAISSQLLSQGATGLEGYPRAQTIAEKAKAINQKNSLETSSNTLGGKRESYRLSNEKALPVAKSYEANGIPTDATPDTTVTIYRAGKGAGIKPGDFVTLDEANAQRYKTMRNNAQISKLSVPLKDLVQSGGFNSEFVYAPKDKSGAIIRPNEQAGRDNTGGQGLSETAIAGQKSARESKAGSENASGGNRPNGEGNSVSEGSGSSTTKTIEQTPPNSSEGKTPSKIAKSIEQKAKDQGLADSLELAGYDKQKIQEQKDMAAKVFENVDEARTILRGEKPLPKDMNPLALVDAAEKYIERTGDANVLMDLSKSHLVSESSHAAQIMRMAAERNPDSITAKLKELKKIKEDTVKRRTGKTVDQAIKVEVEKIKQEVKKTVPTKQDWAGFVKSLQC